jgi:hypothetical protein
MSRRMRQGTAGAARQEGQSRRGRARGTFGTGQAGGRDRARRCSARPRLTGQCTARRGSAGGAGRARRSVLGRALLGVARQGGRGRARCAFEALQNGAGHGWRGGAVHFGDRARRAGQGTAEGEGSARHGVGAGHGNAWRGKTGHCGEEQGTEGRVGYGRGTDGRVRARRADEGTQG